MSKPNASSLAFAISVALGVTGCPDAHGGNDAATEGSDALCVCAPDGGPQPDAWRDDAGPLAASCGAQAAAIDPCGPICDDITGAFWDGTRCVEHSCNCTGSECEVYDDRAECEAAHTGCDASLCLATGGAWFSRPIFCAHFECGAQPGVACDETIPVCDCGTYGIFVEGTGCMPGPLCELIAPLEDEELCGETGGTWTPGICGHTTCGRFSDLDCASPGCVCGAYEIFDDERGCIQSPECDVRLSGEDCSETFLCDGSVCCTGGAGLSHCEAPQCGDPSGLCGPPRP